MGCPACIAVGRAGTAAYRRFLWLPVCAGAASFDCPQLSLPPLISLLPVCGAAACISRPYAPPLVSRLSAYATTAAGTRRPRPLANVQLVVFSHVEAVTGCLRRRVSNGPSLTVRGRNGLFPPMPRRQLAAPAFGQNGRAPASFRGASGLPGCGNGPCGLSTRWPFWA